MYCPICKSFITPNRNKCSICGHIMKIIPKKKKSKKNKQNNKSKNSSSKKNKSKKNKKKKSKKIKAKNRKNSNKKNKKKSKNQFKSKNNTLGGFLGAKTRIYNDRKNFEYEVLGCYNIW